MIMSETTDRENYIRPYFNGYDSYLFHSGKDYEAYRKMGAHPCRRNGRDGTAFSVWAPHAREVSVIAGRTGWKESEGRMHKTRYDIWECFVPGVGRGDNYRFVITGSDGVKRYKADPYALYTERRPENASIVESLRTYRWGDGKYMKNRCPREDRDRPVSIYELHPGSWKKDYSLDKDGFINYGKIAPELCEYLRYMGFTHVELMGICEHPLDQSWGYQVTGYFSPTARYGTPDDLRYLIDQLHQNGISVIIDWVPAHFPKDDFSLGDFDGTHLYEPDDPLLREYPEWGTYAFDYDKPEVRSFLYSSAFYWIREFHADALRVDAVAAMLYTSFGRKEWRPGADGSDQNLSGIRFLRELNRVVGEATGAYLIAEDSSIMSGMTDPVSEGGMGFLFKWSLGWMNDSLRYIERDPVYRRFHHYEIVNTFSYAFTERFILVLSHDEVVHLKKPMLLKMPGDEALQFSTLRAFYTYQFLSPGKKLLFMGQEFGETREWDENRDIDWGLPHRKAHRDLMLTVRRLNCLYRKYPCLYSEMNPSTFEWINSNDGERNILSFIRRNPWNYNGALLVIINFSPVAYPEYALGVPCPGSYKKIFTTKDPSAEEPCEDFGSFSPVREACDYREFRLEVPLSASEAAVFEFPL